jgi:hypothetical protein
MACPAILVVQYIRWKILKRSEEEEEEEEEEQEEEGEL